MSQSDQTPEQLQERFTQAFNDRDLDALVALYEPDAVLVARPGQPVSGPDGIREALDGFLALNGPMEMTHVDTIQSGELAVVAGRWSVRGTGPDGRPVTLGGLAYDVVRRGEDGTWRFVLDNPFADTLFVAG